MKRFFAIVGMLTLSTMLAVGSTIAQDATPIPASSPAVAGADLGLPDLQIELTDSGMVAPTEIAAGRILVTVTNTSQGSEAAPAFYRLAEGEAIDDLNAHLAAIATFFETGEAPDGDPFAFLYDATLAGGTDANPGESGQVIVDLTPGNWAIIDANFAAASLALTVTGEMPAELQAIEANATISEVDEGNVFNFSIEGTITSGTQIVAIVNGSSQPHFVEFDYLPAEYALTDEMMGQFLAMDGTGATPDPSSGLPPYEAFSFPFFANLQSTRTTQWLVGDFQPGSYGITCFVPDPRHDGVPHALMGMYAVFTVA